MPTLGSEPGTNQPIANAYSMPSGRQLSIQHIVLMLIGAFILRNILFRDYRTEEIDALKASGQTEEDIDNYFVPKKASERKKKQMDDAKDFLKMKEDLLSLKEEMKHLQKIMGDNKLKGLENDAGKEETTKKV